MNKIKLKNTFDFICFIILQILLGYSFWVLSTFPHSFIQRMFRDFLYMIIAFVIWNISEKLVPNKIIRRTFESITYILTFIIIIFTNFQTY